MYLLLFLEIEVMVCIVCAEKQEAHNIYRCLL